MLSTYTRMICSPWVGRFPHCQHLLQSAVDAAASESADLFGTLPKAHVSRTRTLVPITSSHARMGRGRGLFQRKIGPKREAFSFSSVRAAKNSIRLTRVCFHSGTRGQFEAGLVGRSVPEWHVHTRRTPPERMFANANWWESFWSVIKNFPAQPVAVVAKCVILPRRV